MLQNEVPEKKRARDERICGKKEIKRIEICHDEMLRVLSGLPATLSGTLDMLMHWLKVTNEELAERALLSDRTIRQLRRDERYGARVRVRTLVQLCIGMNLPPELSQELFAQAGGRLMKTREHLLYRYLLNNWYTETIYDCNDFIERMGQRRLGFED